MYLRVSIHASSREDATCTIRHLQSITSFNPRVLAGGRDTSHDIINISLISVSIHASSREDATSQINRIGTAKKFQSTRPRGRTRRGRDESRFLIPCFNPRVLAGGRDQLNYNNAMQTCVSIHASSREDATFAACVYQKFCCFNPRVLAGGRDRLLRLLIRPMLSFNPRVLAGGRDFFHRQ